MAERQVDLKTAVMLVSAGMAVAGGGGTLLGTNLSASVETRVDQNTADIIETRNTLADHEARLRAIERDFLQQTTEIKADLKYIRMTLDAMTKP